MCIAVLLRCVRCDRFSAATPKVVTSAVPRGQSLTVVAECKSSHEEFGYALWAYHCLLLAAGVAVATKGWYLADSAQESKPLAVSAHRFA
eukprot:10839-Heterococcus_DN1.PRE.2